ncbi:hypothetical protein PGRAN_02480 [Listeria grandensis FSL F6-0971]|uniref:Uncharacterized protein n=1 Tax=Listeria grandensis FSL F6-0971 TaxID=1265819 RepID=W7BIX3_9LIST|nr:hypothetical protein [Listeria grandensis]EUJ24725.1 hypothetical protein PGRAN_02480 [Listeria grandensis FSL F6-0971]
MKFSVVEMLEIAIDARRLLADEIFRCEGALMSASHPAKIRRLKRKFEQSTKRHSEVQVSIEKLSKIEVELWGDEK